MATVQKGTRFLHPQHGVGKVRSVGERAFYGHALANYVELYFERDKLTVTLLEKDLPGVVRSVVSAEQAAELLDCIKTWDGKPQNNWKARANSHQSAIDSGDPFEYAKVFKELALLESQGTLRTCDRDHFNTSLSLLTEEIACSLGKSPSQAHKLINKALAEAAD